MTRIELPHYRRFFSKQEGRYIANPYSGSLGTNPSRGCVTELTFHYRIWVDISSGVEEDFRIIAETYLRQPWSLGSGVTDSMRAEFENNEASLADAAAWISAMADKHGF